MKVNDYIYKVKTSKGYQFYECADAVMAMTLAIQDGFEDVKVESVCEYDITVSTFVAFKVGDRV